jgi:hypothetical protein
MNLVDTPPPLWDQRIEFPLQSVGYSHAATALGHRPLFAQDERGIALVLIRRVPIPLLRGWTARAKVYAYARDTGFLPALVKELCRLGVSHVKLGDAMWGVTGAVADDWRALRRVNYHVFAHDLRLPDEALLARVRAPVRRDIRKGLASVAVTEVGTPADLRDYLDLAAQTGERMRGHDVASVYPRAYFEAILREMVPRRQAAIQGKRRPVRLPARLLDPQPRPDAEAGAIGNVLACDARCARKWLRHLRHGRRHTDGRSEPSPLFRLRVQEGLGRSTRGGSERRTGRVSLEVPIPKFRPRADVGSAPSALSAALR